MSYHLCSTFLTLIKNSVKELPPLPTPEPSKLADELTKVRASWDTIRQGYPPADLPEDFRELFRPHTDDLPYSKLWRWRYQTGKRECPPPLRWGPPLRGFTKCFHIAGCPDWYVWCSS